jgi:predicted lipid-binding transport protein (Tim44 family)
MSAPAHPTQSQPTQPPPPAWQPPPEWGQTTNPTPPPQRKLLRVVRFIVAMIVGLMAGVTAMGMVAFVSTVIGLYQVAPDFAQALEGIALIPGWVVGSWLIFHFWSMPVIRTVLPGWGQRPDQEADR